MFTIYIGCVFSSKTSNAIVHLLKYSHHNNIVFFKHGVDTRFDNIDKDKVISHNKIVTLKSISIIDHKDILKLSKKADVIGIDELQFFSIEIVDTIKKLLSMGKIIVASSLNADYRRQQWETLSVCLPLATDVILLKGTCNKCLVNNIATCSFNTKDKDNDKQIIKSSDKLFIPLCHKCYDSYYYK